LETKDFIKAFALLCLFGGVAPVVGYMIQNSRKFQRGVLALMCFMTTQGIFAAGEWGLTILPFEYRSHARGYHFYFIIVPALILIFANLFKNWRASKLIPPGFWLYYIFCGAATLSIFTAEYPTYVLMALLKSIEITVIGIAVYNFLRTDEDLKFLMNCMAWTMIWQTVVVLMMKYVHHIYQVYGTFEHQNSLSTFTTMIGLVFLGVALGPKEKKSNWFLFAYICCAIIVQASLSRGSLATFALGTVIVVAFSLIDRVTKRRMVVLGGLTAVAAIGLAFTMDTIIGRFNDYGNDESKRTREQLNQASLAMVHDHPLGVGWNNYGRMINHPYHYGDHIDNYYRSLHLTVDPTYQKGISESLYYLVLAENGYLALALLVAFFAQFLWMNLRAAFVFRTDFIGSYSIGMFAGCAVIYLQSTLERVLTQPRNMSLWFLLIGASAKIEIWRRKELVVRNTPPEPTQWEQNQLASLTERAV
jgi:hypothetical protein